MLEELSLAVHKLEAHTVSIPLKVISEVAKAVETTSELVI